MNAPCAISTKPRAMIAVVTYYEVDMSDGTVRKFVARSIAERFIADHPAPSLAAAE